MNKTDFFKSAKLKLADDNLLPGGKSNDVLLSLLRELYDSVTETLKPYKLYLAQLTQIGTGSPVATVAINELGGEVIWGRIDPGNYSATLNGKLLGLKTFSFIGNSSPDAVIFTFKSDISPNSIQLQTYNYDVNVNQGLNQDDLLVNTPVMIIVMN